MRRHAVLLPALMLALTLGSIGSAQATHCSTPLVIHSYIQGLTSNPLPLMCILDPDTHEIDYRLLSPGATSLRVQYLNDLTVPTLKGWLNGVGFTEFPITLTRTDDGLGGFYYISATHSFAQRVVDQGCLEARVQVGEDEETGEPIYERTAYHTLTKSCPDFP